MVILFVNNILSSKLNYDFFKNFLVAFIFLHFLSNSFIFHHTLLKSICNLIFTIFPHLFLSSLRIPSHRFITFKALDAYAYVY